MTQHKTAILSPIDNTAGWLNSDRSEVVITYPLERKGLIVGTGTYLQRCTNNHILVCDSESEIEALLVESRENSFALDLSLSLFDGTLSDALRLRIATELDSLFESVSTVSYVLDILLASPMPSVVDFSSTQRIVNAYKRVLKFVETIEDCQPRVCLLRNAWLRLSDDELVRKQGHPALLGVLVNFGIFRRLAIQARDQVQLDALQPTILSDPNLVHQFNANTISSFLGYYRSGLPLGVKRKLSYVRDFISNEKSSPVAKTLRLSVSQLSTYRWSFEQDVIRYKELGFNAISVWRAKLSDYSKHKACVLLEEAGMKVSSLRWAGGFTGSNGRTFIESLHDALDAIEIAADLRADCLVIIAGGRSGHTRNHAKRIFTSALRVLTEAAQAVGVRLAVKPMIELGGEYSCIPESLDLISALGPSNCGIVLDCHALARDATTMDWLASIVPFIQLVELGDGQGQGQGPLQEIVQTIEGHGYRGYYEVDLIHDEIAQFDYNSMLSQFYQTVGGM